MPTSRLYWILCLVAVAIGAWRVSTGQVRVAGLAEDREFAFDLVLEFRDAVGPFELELFVPESRLGTRLRDEELAASDLDLRLDDVEAGRRLIVRGDRADLPSRVRYTARVSLTPVVFELPASLRWTDLGAPARLDSTDLIPTGHPEMRTTLADLFAEALANDPAPTGPEGWQRTLQASGIGPIEAVDRLHARCLEGLRPADFSGHTDALTALRLGEASCGGKSRLMVALARTLGLEARMIGGLILGDGTRKRTSHVWVEVRLGDQWVPFDPLNGYRAERPAHYLQLYEGDLPLIVHARGLAFDYGFRAPLERIPSVWNSESLAEGDESALPLLRRDQFSLILLAPFALLVTVFLRQVVGMDSIGVFLPVLLGFCVTQVGWTLSGALLLVTLVLGVLVRLLLTRLSMLHVPRAALLITFLVLLFLVFTVSLEEFGIHTARGVLILPLAALAMAVERFTVVALDRGSVEALKLLAQTLLLSALSAFVLLQPLFKVLTVSFPEILIIVLAEIIVIGQFRGLRWIERWRFRDVPREGAA